MRERRIARSKVRNARTKELRTLALVLVITCVPVFTTLFAIISTTEPDLSYFTPRNPQVGNYLLLNWSVLQKGHLHNLSSGPTGYMGAVVQALGYMTEGDGATGTGELVRDFMLRPEAGNALHPAHRFGDQMVAVHLQEGNQIRFSPKNLVSGGGNLSSIVGRSDRSETPLPS
jgi:hypothetical protein